MIIYSGCDDDDCDSIGNNDDCGCDDDDDWDVKGNSDDSGCDDGGDDGDGDDDDVADGELYDVGWGRKMYLMCSGKGPPTGW